VRTPILAHAATCAYTERRSSSNTAETAPTTMSVSEGKTRNGFMRKLSESDNTKKKHDCTKEIGRTFQERRHLSFTTIFMLLKSCGKT
jgi:hypothetical protein